MTGAKTNGWFNGTNGGFTVSFILSWDHGMKRLKTTGLDLIHSKEAVMMNDLCKARSSPQVSN